MHNKMKRLKKEEENATPRPTFLSVYNKPIFTNCTVSLWPNLFTEKSMWKSKANEK